MADTPNPILLGQQCWELLHLCWHWCANGSNNSQRLGDQQYIMGIDYDSVAFVLSLF